MKGYDFNQGVDYHALLQSYKYSGFQATNFGLAVEEINKMISKRFLLLCDLTRLSLVLCREEPIPEEKRESCANTELGPEVKITIQSIPDISGFTLAKCR